MTSLASPRSEIRGLPAVARSFLRLLEGLQAGTLQLVTPAGEHLIYRGELAGPEATLQVSDWSACGAILRGGDIGVAECYRDGKIDTPDLLALLLLALANQDILERTLHGSFWGTLLYRLRHLMNRNTRAGSRKNIHAHYDIGNDFYRLWLDPSMTYSSALFACTGMSLQEAQAAKYDRLLDRLGVGRGDHLLEIGCGWGALAERAAARGCYVTGISLSQEQLAWARERVRGTPLEGRIHFRFMDYRDLEGRFDAIISIEMLEAVGMEYWGSYFATLRRSLKPGGRAAVQTITIADERFDAYRRGTDFIQQYIFPGGTLPSPAALQREIRHAGLDLLNYHGFGADYARTLRLWRENFEAALPAIRQQGFDEAFIRLWRFYLCYCEAGFLTRRTDVCQALVTN